MTPPSETMPTQRAEPAPEDGPPRFTIVTPVYEPGLDVLRDTIASVRAQTYDSWEWVLVDDCSPSQTVRDTIHAAARLDPRIRLIERASNGHIVAASNDGLEAARGEFVALLDHDDLLEPDALEKVSEAIDTFDDVDYLYTDEDKVDPSGRFYDLFLKPTWSPERLLGQMYTCHFSVIRRSLLGEVGGFRQGYDGSQDHDLVLRVGEKARRVVHVPHTLYHWRVVTGSTAGDAQAKPYAAVAGLRAVQASLDRRGVRATAVNSPLAFGHYLVERELDPSVSVSIVIPTLGQEGIVWGSRRNFVVETVRAALAKTQHTNVEVVVVYDPPTPAYALEQLREVAGDKLVLVPYHRRFNFSEKNNVGFAHSSGSRIVLLNDDIDVISDGWLEQLVAPLDELDVGMTGAKLYFSDGTIQHAGHQYVNGQYVHPYLGSPREDPGRLGDLAISREVSGVTAACAALRREVYEEVGGLSEALPVNFNDVDLSYKVRRSGRRIVWVAHCELYHFESRTRPRTIESWEHLDTMARWGVPGVDEYLPAL